MKGEGEYRHGRKPDKHDYFDSALRADESARVAIEEPEPELHVTGEIESEEPKQLTQQSESDK